MGGEGSGRKPDFVKRILETKEPAANLSGDSLFLPNYSGVQPAALKTSAALHDAVTLAGTKDYLTLSGQEITLGTVDISDDTNLVAGTNCTLSGDTLNVDDAFLVNNANDTTTGTITMAGGIITGDASSADTAYVPMVLYNTDDTPPAANTVPIGTIYIQYTA